MDLNQKVEWFLKYYSGYESHSNMYEERLEKDNNFCVDLGIEQYILDSLKTNTLIVLTGDAGDGKTKVIRNIQTVISSSIDIEFIEDFSELSITEQERYLDKIHSEIKENKLDKKFIIAGNSGIFTKALINYDNNNDDINDSKLFDLIENRKNSIIINFNKRNFGREPINGEIKNTQLYEIVSGFISDIEQCKKQCVTKERGLCPFEFNINMLRKPTVIEGLRAMLHTLFLIGIHVTFRELLSVLAYSITGGKKCSDFIELSTHSVRYLFFNNLFEYTIRKEGNDRILSEFSKIDIAYKDISEFDYKIYTINEFFMQHIDKVLYNNYILYEEKNNADIFTKKLLRNSFIKRYLFFVAPNLLHNSNDTLSLLPLKYIKEFNKVINEIRFNSLLTNRDRNQLIQGIELGLNRLAAPKSTNGSFEVYDSPTMISHNFKIKYKINMSDIELLFILEDNENDKNLNVKNLSYDENNFYIRAFKDDNPIEPIAFLKIDYELFEQICMARDGVIYPARKGNTRDSRLDTFREDIVYNMVIKDNLEVCWTGIDKSFAENFKLVVFNNRRTNSKGVSVEKI